VEKFRIPKKDRLKSGLFSFQKRNFLPANAIGAMKERDNMFAKMERKYEYRFAFCNGDEDPMDGTDLTRKSAYGSTTMDMKMVKDASSHSSTLSILLHSSLSKL
jgi:hypothetical protein